MRLLRGEGRFQVAHDAARPFIVAAADAAVRAVGTAFTVRLREAAQVDVLVSEGKVAIAAAARAAARRRSPPATPRWCLPDRVSVSRVEPQLLERRLAWTSGRLEFRGETLAEAVAEFNRYNRRQIRLADPSLGALRVGGNFKRHGPGEFRRRARQRLQAARRARGHGRHRSSDHPDRHAAVADVGAAFDGMVVSSACTLDLLGSLAGGAARAGVRRGRARAESAPEFDIAAQDAAERAGRFSDAVAPAAAVRLRRGAGHQHARGLGSPARRRRARPHADAAPASRSK